MGEEEGKRVGMYVGTWRKRKKVRGGERREGEKGVGEGYREVR